MQSIDLKNYSVTNTNQFYNSAFHDCTMVRFTFFFVQTNIPLCAMWWMCIFAMKCEKNLYTIGTYLPTYSINSWAG
jgi:hypothetical protein